MQAPMQQAIPPPGVHGMYGPAPGSGYPPQGYPQPQNMGVNPQGGYPTQASTFAGTMAAMLTPTQCLQMHLMGCGIDCKTLAVAAC